MEGAVKVCDPAFELIARKRVESVVVSDQEAVDAISILRSCKEAGGVLVEPACGAALAALKPSLFKESEKVVVVIVCGGNAISDVLLEEYKRTAYEKTNDN